MQTPNSEKLVTLIGGSGFVGRHIVRALAKRGYRIRVACRRPDLAGHVLPLGTPGQIALVQANVRYPASVAAACEGAHAVINLAAVFHNGRAQSYEGVHVFGAEAVAKAAKAAKAQVLIHLSGLGASDESANPYVHSRGEGEDKAKANFPGAIILRPSVIFGPEDRFLNKIANLARFSPVVPVIGASAKLQPVFVGDVAEAAALLVDRGHADGKIYELGGPDVKTNREVTDFVMGAAMRKRLVFAMPFGLAKLAAMLTAWLPGAPITSDQVQLLQDDNVVSPAAESEGRTLRGLGLAARGMAAIAPSYLYRFRKAGQFTARA